MAEHPFETVRIKIEHRGEKFYISSDQVPGLWLWGKDLPVLFDDVIPAIQSLYKHNRGIDVEVREPFISKLSRWLYAHLIGFKRTRASEKFNIYSVGGRHLTGVHG